MSRCPAKYLKIVSYLKREDTHAELKFVYSSSELFTKFTAAFSEERTPFVRCPCTAENFLLTVLAKLLKPDIIMFAEEISTRLLENLDNYFQDTIVGEPTQFVLNGQKLTLT